MKKFLTPLFLFLTISIFAQNTDDIALVIVEQMPSFPGGEVEMMKFIQQNVKYPQYEKEHGISGKCYVSFVVEKDGRISETKILKGVASGQGCDAEALRVVNIMPKWVPGKQNGKEVRVQFNLPIKFILQPKIALSTKDTAYYTYYDALCSRAKSEYYRIASKQDQGYLVKELDTKTNQLLETAECSSLDPFIKNGKYVKYSDNKFKMLEGAYSNDKRVNIWTIWHENEKDSLVVECFTDGTYRNKFIPASQKLNNKYNITYQIEVMPSFDGGEREMMKFIQKNITYPTTEKNKDISGTCYISFTVEVDGKLSDIKILKGIDKGIGLDNEALRVINLMPDWIPGSQFGRYVRVNFNLPIKFTLR